ncbi:Sec-independent protein translocase protein TatB [Seohaeicola nanhaiensis]|uniref:Sec-independent protein translocase protein TatB n=1 Tax=Seohaeicola nanhaiensis TaxID=1387282 RepID=A0ABV9KEH1_9RHOB
MLDLGWGELLLIGIVALIVVGPKDLPVLFRNVGLFVGRAKGMAREFTRAMHDAADEAGVKDVTRTLKTATNPLGSALDGVRDAARDMSKSLDPTKFDKPKPDPNSETGKLAAERAESAKKIQAATARAAAERKAREAAEALKKADEMEAELTKTPETKP